MFESFTPLAQTRVLPPIQTGVHTFVANVGLFPSYKVSNTLIRRNTWLTIAAMRWSCNKGLYKWLPYITLSGEVLD